MCTYARYMSDLLTGVCELRRWHEQKHPTLYKLPWMVGQPLDEQTRKTFTDLKARSKTVIVSVLAGKLKALANSRGSYPLADMETLDNTLDQIHIIFVR